MPRLRIWQYLLLLISGVPAFLFAYLGHFSRLIVDDYCVFHVGRSMDVWQGILFYFNAHTGSYSRILLHFLLVPIDILATSLTPAAIVILSSIGSLLDSASSCRESLARPASQNSALDSVGIDDSRFNQRVYVSPQSFLLV